MRAAQACLGLGEGLEPARSRLVASGWERAALPEGFAGPPAQGAAGREYYAKGLDGVLLTSDPGGCMFNLRVPHELKMRRIVRILSTAFDAAPLSEDGVHAMWSLANGQAALAHRQRDRNEASVQLIVTSSDKKKN